MKQFEAKSKQIGENVFYIRPFPALVAANLSGDLAAVLTALCRWPCRTAVIKKRLCLI